jgi:bifunctional polynucleotide phosphatase/kinase
LTLRDGTVSPAQALFKKKIEAVLGALDVPLTLYAACANDGWRKPRTGIWEHYVRNLAREGEMDVGGSFLVGDAAGRVGDHEACDRHFCLNVGIRFFTPEMWFLGKEEEEYVGGFQPWRYLEGVDGRKGILAPEHVCTASAKSCYEDETPEFLLKHRSPSLWLLVGLPGAGKSTYYFNKMESLGYERVDPSILGASGDVEEKTSSILSSCRAAVLGMSHDKAVI